MGIGLAAALVLSQASVAAEDVAFVELAANRNEAAIEKIEGNPSLDADNPARLINLGIAYAREGRGDLAKAMFSAAARSDTGVQLETATGEWVDSRTLARIGLAKLARGEFSSGARMAAR